jgi:hypothetical protein
MSGFAPRLRITQEELCDQIGVNEIARHLLASPDFRAKFVTNTTDPVDASDACDATGYHGFSHVEGGTVTPITSWILSHLP